MNRLLLTRTISALAPLFFATTHLHAASLAPHRAYYDLEAGRLDSNAGIAAITGKLAYEITGSDCGGYAVSYRIANRYVQGEGTATQTTDNQQTSFESGDGLELDLQQKNFLNTKLENQSRVKVKKSKAGAPGVGEIVAADTTQIKTDAKAVFPTDYQKRLLQAAIAGEVRHEAMVFEGSDGDKALRAIAFIGAKKQLGNQVEQSETDAETAALLNKLPYWGVTVSYYSADGRGDDAPIYQATFNMLENGVSTNLLLDYGTYALKGKLSKIELLKPETCN